MSVRPISERTVPIIVTVSRAVLTLGGVVGVVVPVLVFMSFIYI